MEIHMRLPRWSDLLTFAFLVALPLPALAQPQPSVEATAGGAPVDAEIFVWTVTKPQSLGTTGSDGQLAFDPQMLTNKGVTVAAGTAMNVYRLACTDDKLRLLLAPATVASSDLGCADKNKPLVAGQDCGCDDPVAAVMWGPGMRVNVPAIVTSGGNTAMKVGLGVSAAAIAGGVIYAATRDDDDNGVALSSFSGTYAGTFNQTATTCNPPAFAPSFNGSSILTVTDDGNATNIIRESIDRTYTGRVTAAGGTLNGQGTFPSGTPWTGTVNVAFADGTPKRISVVENINNGNRNCSATYALNNAAKQ
jgi:hypothetical protein